MSGPIKPSEIEDRKASTIPSEVFDSFNELIAERWDGRQSKFTQEEVLSLLMSKLQVSTYNTTSRKDIFTKKWLDVEPLYRQVGWKVDYDKPGYNETYEATFTFQK
jgi:hypothetical protein